MKNKIANPYSLEVKIKREPCHPLHHPSRCMIYLITPKRGGEND